VAIPLPALQPVRGRPSPRSRGRLAHPVAAFFVLSLLTSWSLLAALLLLQRSTSSPPLPLAGVLLLLAKFGPSLAALLLTGWSEGSAGIEALLRRLFLWRLAPRVWLAVLAVPVGVTALALGVYRLRGGNLPGPPPSVMWLLLPVLLSKTFVGGGLGEELGWRGYALPRLLETHGPARASVLVGLVWAVWHWPALWINGQGPLSIAAFSLAVVALSRVFTWIVRRSENSLLPAVILHALLNTPLSVVESYAPRVAESTALLFTLYGALFLLGAGVEVLAGRRDVDRPALGFRTSSPPSA